MNFKLTTTKWNWMNLSNYKVLTVSFVLSSRWPFFHQVILAGGLEPELWHNKSYLLPAERGWFDPKIFTFKGPTERKIIL